MATDSLEVEFKVKDLQKLLTGFNQASDAAKRSGRAMDDQGKAARRTQGPYQRLIRLQMESGRAQRSGDFAYQRDVSNALKNTERQIARIEKVTTSTFGQKLSTLIRSSRFSVGEGGGQIMPLVGKALDLFGGGAAGAEAGAAGAEAAGGPVGWILLAGSAAEKTAEALFHLEEAASQSARVFENLQLSTGATGPETARLFGIGSATGMNAQQMAALSQSVQEHISDGGFGMAAGMQLGVQNFGRPFGNPDEGGQLLTLINNLAKVSDPMQRLQLARQAGAEAALPYTYLSAQQRGFIGSDSKVQAQVFNPQFQQQAADFLASLGRIQEGVENVLAALGPSLIGEMTDFLNGLATGLEKLAGFLTAHQEDVYKFFQFLEAVGDVGVGDYAGALTHLANIVNGKDGLSASLEKNSAATDRNTAMLGAPGTYGHINRPGALPPGMGGQSLQRNGDYAEWSNSAF